MTRPSDRSHTEHRRAPAEPTSPSLRAGSLLSGPLVPCLLVLLGLALTFLGGAAVERQALRDARARFELVSHRVQALVLRRLNLLGYGLRGTRGVFAASKSVERGEFRSLVASRDLPREFPGTLGIGYIERVPRDAVGAFLERVRADEAPGFEIRAAPSEVPASHSPLMVVTYFEPAASDEARLGFDAATDVAWRDAAETALRTGEVGATVPVALQRGGETVRGVICVLPVYRSGALPSTPEARQRECVGWVYMPVVVEDLLAELAAASEGLLDVHVFDGPADASYLLYDGDGHLADHTGAVTADELIAHTFHDEVAFQFGGRSWTMLNGTSPTFETTITTAAAAGVRAGGTFASLLVGALAWSLLRTKRRAGEMASAMTADLRARTEELDRLAMVVRRTQNAAIVTDANRRIVWVNEGFTRITGYTLDEARGKSPGSFLQFDKTDRATVDHMATCVREGRGCRVEILNRSKDGREYWLDVDIQPLHDEAGTLSGFMAVESDITHLIEHRNRLASMFSAMAEGVVVQSVDGTIVDANPAAEEILGLTRDQLLGRTSTDPRWRAIDLNGADFPGELHPISHTLRTGAPVRDFVMGIETPEGERRWISVSTEAVRGADGAVNSAVASFSDVTAARLDRERLHSALEQARAATQAKSEFLANMSHEIRTPMTAIMGYTDLLYEDGDLARAPSSRVEYINTIRRNGEHLLSIINDILDIAKIEAGKMTVESIPVSPIQIIEDVVSLMSVRAQGKNISLEVCYETSVPETITSDPTRLKQVLINLVGNAIKFTELGAVTLRIGLDRFNARGPAIRFDIEDTGLGMNPEQLSRLFGAFEQADTSTTRKFGGTGLGLRISKRLAEMMGGDIEVRSEPGKGSTFTVVIAAGDLAGVALIERDRAAQVVQHAPTTKTPETPLKGVRILLAEDGPDNQRLISHHLKKAGAEVKIAGNGKIAVEMLTHSGTMDGPLADPAPFDLVLTDMQMPELDGYGATRLLRAKGCVLPIVALTAHAMAGDAEKCLGAGCDAYATKPIDKEKLIETCRSALQGRNGYHPPPRRPDRAGVALSGDAAVG
ncbi:MAG: CHASE domain-containing protein [Phycisphaerales bacterium]